MQKMSIMISNIFQLMFFNECCLARDYLIIAKRVPLVSDHTTTEQSIFISSAVCALNLLASKSKQMIQRRNSGQL